MSNEHTEFKKSQRHKVLMKRPSTVKLVDVMKIFLNHLDKLPGLIYWKINDIFVLKIFFEGFVPFIS